MLLAYSIDLICEWQVEVERRLHLGNNCRQIVHRTERFGMSYSVSIIIILINSFHFVKTDVEYDLKARIFAPMIDLSSLLAFAEERESYRVLLKLLHCFKMGTKYKVETKRE